MRNPLEVSSLTPVLKHRPPFVFPTFSEYLEELNILHIVISWVLIILGHFKSLSQAFGAITLTISTFFPKHLVGYLDRAGQVSYSGFQMSHYALRAEQETCSLLDSTTSERIKENIRHSSLRDKNSYLCNVSPGELQEFSAV